MVLDKLILLFGYFLIFVKFTPISADVTHGHALSMESVYTSENRDDISSKENMKIFSEILKIPQDFTKTINLDIVQYLETDIILGTSDDSHLTFDLQTHSQYSLQQPSAHLQSSTVQTDKDLYIKIIVNNDSSDFDNSITMTIVTVFCLLVMLSKLMNYKSKFKPDKEIQDITNEDTRGLMWNLTSLDDILWKKEKNRKLQINQETYTETEIDENSIEDLNNRNKIQSNGNRHHLNDNYQSECSFHRPRRMTFPLIGQKLKWTYCVGVVLVLTVAAVLAVANFKQKHVLKIDIPNGAIIRKIRSYTANPDLSAISLNSSSMALVTRLQLLETSCLTDRSRCETYALCDTELGHMTCRCKRGFYVKDRKCRACSTSCRDGYYMSRACTAESDVICRPCSTCTGATYEVAGCSSTQDTICIGAAFPVNDVKWNKLFQHSTNTSVSMSSSNNVFFEKLGGIQRVEPRLYVPNNGQVQDVENQRPSGLKIKIKVSNLYLIPHYVDLDHNDDNDFIITDTSQLESNKKKYLKNKKDFCRHQLPDHYKMVLYITRNHTSAAQQISCNSNNPDIPQCPAGYKDGDIFLDRQINKECPYKLKGQDNLYFQEFDQKSNNIFCPHTTKLFTETFGLTPDQITNYTFPSDECYNSDQNCKECLKNPECSNREGVCCDINCYTKSHCEKSYSDVCPNKEVECASGDVHNFILEPVFSSVDERFLCHLKYKPPPHLYQIDYTVYLPKIDYYFKKRTKFVKGDREFNENGVFRTDFITAHHNWFPNIHDEIILIGTDFDDQEKPTEFWVHGLKEPHQFNTRKKFKVRPHRSNFGHSDVYSTHIQLERPFMYSSRTFHNGGCIEKNFSNIYPPQPLYLPHGIKVDVSKTKTGAGFEYQTANANVTRSATIRMSFDNSSIIAYYQDDFGRTLIDGTSLSGGLIWNPNNETWLITIKGKLLQCPGYLTVDVYDQFMEAKLDNFDVFIKCPVDFTLTFELQTTRTDLPNLFVACINDSSISHHIVLSMIHPPTYPPTQNALMEMKHSISQFPWLPIIVTLSFTTVIFLVLVIVFLVIYRMEPAKGSEVKKYISPQTTTYIGAKDDDRNVNQPLTLTLYSKPVSKGVSCTLGSLYIAYAVTFTFSMLLGVFYIVQGPLVGNLTIVSNTSAKIHQSVGNHMLKISKYEENELMSAFNQTLNRMKACSVHLQQNIDKIEDTLTKDWKRVLNRFYRGHGIIRGAINDTISAKSEIINNKFSKFLDDADVMLKDHFGQIQENFISLLENFKKNQWLRFPKERFGDQQYITGEEKTFEGLMDFMKWLEIDGVDQVLGYRSIIKNRLQKSVEHLIPTDLHHSVNFDMGFQKMAPVLNDDYKTKFAFQILNQPEDSWINNHSSHAHEGNPDESYNETILSKAQMINRMKELLLPVFVCFFLFMDFFMLTYRILWLVKTSKKAKSGIDVQVPTDHVAEKIQFWQTGINNRKSETKATENPYSFYSENSENILSGKNDPIQLYANTAQKSKQEILREIWNKKQKQKRCSYTDTKSQSIVLRTLHDISAFLYKHLIAPILWRFILVGAFVLVICLVTKATSDLVSIETATFLIDTKSIIPQLHRQVDITNNLVHDVTSDLNIILNQHRLTVDSEVATINNFLIKAVNSQNVVLQTLLTDLCSRSDEICKPSLLRVQELMTSCNFLPVTTTPFKEMDEGLFVHYLHSELVPLVSTLRQILFNTCYILFGYACLMLICHTFIRIVIYYLIKTCRLPKAMTYLVSNTNDCWKVNEGSNTKSMYRSSSVIESCESGVVGDIEDHREVNM